MQGMKHKMWLQIPGEIHRDGRRWWKLKLLKCLPMLKSFWWLQSQTGNLRGKCKVIIMELTICLNKRWSALLRLCTVRKPKVQNIDINIKDCHGPAGVPRLATRCLCVLSTRLVVCLVPCAPMSIVCPLPSCYLIIVSVAPAVSPSLPSFVSLYSLLVSAVLCWSVVFHVSYVTWVFHVDCAPVLCLPACLLVFPLRGGFCCSFVSFYY